MWQKTRAADLRGALLATLGSGVVAHLLPCQHLQEQPQVSGRGKGGGGEEALGQLSFQHCCTQNILSRRNRNREVTIQAFYSLVTGILVLQRCLGGKCMLEEPSGNVYREKTNKNNKHDCSRSVHGSSVRMTLNLGQMSLPNNAGTPSYNRSLGLSF